MSEIASKANTRTNPSLAQPLVKKADNTTPEMLFAALFGGVVAAENDADSTLGGISLVNTDTGSDANLNGDSNVLAAMQAVAAMMYGQRGVGAKDELSADSDKPMMDDSLIDEDDGIVGADPTIIGPMPLQQQTGTYLPATESSALMAEMAFEDEVPTSHQHKDLVKPIPPRPALYPSGLQMKMAESSSSSSLPTMKSAEKLQSHIQPIHETLPGELDPEYSKLHSDGRADVRPVIKPAVYQHNLSRVSFTNSKSANGSDQALTNMDADMQLDSPDNLIRAVATQTERGVGNINGQSGSGESLSANAVRQMQAGGLSVNAQMSQQNNGQSGGQSGGHTGGLISANAGMTNGSMMDMLDMAQDNWTEMLLQRVERGLAGGKDKIDFHLNPRNLGRMRISLVVQNERTNVHIQTETAAAAHLLNDAEARLAQLMDASGLKFGNLTSQYNQNFGSNFSGQNSGQRREGGSADAMVSDTAGGKDEDNAEISIEQTENLINMQA